MTSGWHSQYLVSNLSLVTSMLQQYVMKSYTLWVEVAMVDIYLIFRSLTWSTIKLNMEAGDVKSKDGITRDVFPATYGHSMIKWETRLLLAGFSKNNSDSIVSQEPVLFNCSIE